MYLRSHYKKLLIKNLEVPQVQILDTWDAKAPLEQHFAVCNRNTAKTPEHGKGFTVC
jgi:hypothetical protein